MLTYSYVLKKRYGFVWIPNNFSFRLIHLDTAPRSSGLRKFQYEIILYFPVIVDKRFLLF